MVLEVAILHIRPNQNQAFEKAFKLAAPIISAMNGYINHQLKKCIEQPNQYILLVNWDTLADHEIGFRQSSEYQQWKKLLHHFYEPFPTVLHYE